MVWLVGWLVGWSQHEQATSKQQHVSISSIGNNKNNNYHNHQANSFGRSILRNRCERIISPSSPLRTRPSVGRSVGFILLLFLFNQQNNLGVTPVQFRQRLRLQLDRHRHRRRRRRCRCRLICHQQTRNGELFVSTAAGLVSPTSLSLMGAVISFGETSAPRTCA